MIHRFKLFHTGNTFCYGSSHRHTEIFLYSTLYCEIIHHIKILCKILVFKQSIIQRIYHCHGSTSLSRQYLLIQETRVSSVLIRFPVIRIQSRVLAKRTVRRIITPYVRQAQLILDIPFFPTVLK